ncbi:MAG: DUF1616 domain-containing protein [Methanobacteriota archaeon]
MPTDWDDFVDGAKYPNDLPLVIASAIISAVGIFLLEEGDPLRALLGIPILFFLPGYALTAALWPAKHEVFHEPVAGKPKFLEGGLATTERLVLSVTLSIVMVVIIGLALNYLSSITLLPIMVTLTGFTVACCAVAWNLRKSLPREKRFIVSMRMGPGPAGSSYPGAEKAITVVLAACIVFSMGGVFWLLANPAEAGPYTEFYMLDEDGMLDNLPKNLTVGEIGTLVVSVANHEHDVVDYTVTASSGNGTTLVYTEVPSIRITDSGRWATNATVRNGDVFEQEYTIQFSAPGRYRVVWRLEAGGQETDYELHLWVNVA